MVLDFTNNTFCNSLVNMSLICWSILTVCMVISPSLCVSRSDGSCYSNASSMVIVLATEQVPMLHYCLQMPYSELSEGETQNQCSETPAPSPALFVISGALQRGRCMQPWLLIKSSTSAIWMPRLQGILCT